MRQLAKRWHVRRRTVADLYVELAFRSPSAVSEQRVSVMQLASTVKVDQYMRLAEWFGSNVWVYYRARPEALAGLAELIGDAAA